MPKTLHEQYNAAQEAYIQFVLEHAGLEYTAETYSQLNKLRDKIAQLRAKLEAKNAQHS